MTAPPLVSRLSARRVDSAAGASHIEPPLALVVAILLGHAVYGLLVTRSAALATLHASVTFAVALWIATTSSMRQVAIACAYIAGSQILWRIGKAQIPWESAKYGICLLAVITLSRIRRPRWDWPAMAYLALLVPSTLLSFFEEPFEYARQQVSFNLSGPIALALTTWFAAYLRPTRADVQRLFLAIIAPAVSLGAVALAGAVKLDELSFSDASNFQTSAGYGPNQVSSVLGLGALLAALLALLVERGARERFVFGVIALVLGAQSALTFSRGGVFSALGALIVASPFLLKGSRNRVAATVVALLLVASVEVVVLPRLNAVTGGALSTRFRDPNPTGRVELVRQELQTFSENPVFGVGPAALDDREGGGTVSVHTEFSRLLAQHGTFGLFALLTMLLLAWRAVASQEGASGRAIAIALLAWSALTMTHAAMRLALVPFAYGIAAAGFFTARARTKPNETRPRPRLTTR